MKILLAALMLMSFGVSAVECTDLVKCVETVSKLTGKKYIYDSTLKGNFQTSSNVEINAENADTLFTYVLDINGYSRFPTSVKDVYTIVNSRDIRYETVPTFTADSSTTTLSIPANYDYYQFSYKFKHYKQNQMRALSNSARPFMSRYGRIIESKNSGIVTLQEKGVKIPQIFEMMKANDRELSKDEIIAMEKEEKKEEMREKHERKEEGKPTKSEKK